MANVAGGKFMVHVRLPYVHRADFPGGGTNVGSILVKPIKNA